MSTILIITSEYYRSRLVEFCIYLAEQSHTTTTGGRVDTVGELLVVRVVVDPWNKLVYSEW